MRSISQRRKMASGQLQERNSRILMSSKLYSAVRRLPLRILPKRRRSPRLSIYVLATKNHVSLVVQAHSSLSKEEVAAVRSFAEKMVSIMPSPEPRDGNGRKP